ncbi:MAG: hypothetical protein ABFS02_10685, partial [Pseudomonadota bacterium]
SSRPKGAALKRQCSVAILGKGLPFPADRALPWHFRVALNTPIQGGWTTRRARFIWPCAWAFPLPPVRLPSCRALNDSALPQAAVFRRAVSIAITLALCWFLGGCAARSQTPPAKPPPAATQDTGWWSARFQIQWPDQDAPPWHMDALLADKLIAPALDRYGRNIQLWRFHRRAARDNAGHRFSFVFYSSARTAYDVFRLIEKNPLFRELLSSHRVLRAHFDDLATTHHPKVEDSSDESWPPLVRKSWPKFIMGASEMWLDLIHGLAELESGRQSLKDEALYRKVHDKISELWKFQGQHFFLHHLNALFGYEEMMVTDQNSRAMRF